MAFTWHRNSRKSSFETAPIGLMSAEEQSIEEEIKSGQKIEGGGESQPTVFGDIANQTEKGHRLKSE